MTDQQLDWLKMYLKMTSQIFYEEIRDSLRKAEDQIAINTGLIKE